MQVDDHLARVCLRLLLNAPLIYSYNAVADGVVDGVPRGDLTTGLEELLRYVMVPWPKHVVICEEADDVSQISTLLENVLGSMNNSGAPYTDWHRIILLLRMDFRDPGDLYTQLDYAEELLPSSTTLFGICHFGFYRTLSTWWSSCIFDPNQRNNNEKPLVYIAANAGSLNVCERLIKLGANVNAHGNYSSTALHVASSKGYEEIVNLLLEEGADVRAWCEEYGTALQTASLNGHGKIVKMVLEKDVDINAKDGMYATALQAASCSGHEEIVKLLLKEGADIEVGGGNYETALQAASYQGYEEIVQILLEGGADINAPGSTHETALLKASNKGHKNIFKNCLKEALI